ncbi:hypothetical protein [Variovorax saccharolyticus]|uniref:hypothetical protein n=1 Tax=Variovorax saccharolyticus TaxID=3053516 RepID=UPI0025768315|nr:hypothetical protein [Variovorax sp. J31P216]MDM0026705.1 hypothetical protein [Variovorax sp. J31P216]
MPSSGLHHVGTGAAIVGLVFAVTAVFLLVGGDASPSGGDRGRELALLATAGLAGAAFLVAVLCGAVFQLHRWRLRRQHESKRLSAAERRADIAMRRARIRAELRDFR